MKNLMKLSTLGFMATMGIGASCATLSTSLPETKAGYFRVWAGFKKQGLSQEQFLNELPSFMDETVDLYKGKGLSNYLVIIPPKEKSAVIPDEFALVAMSDEGSYRAVRETPEGQKYSARHWDVFDRTNSKSAASVVDYFKTLPESLESGMAYDLIGRQIDWSKGYTMAFVGQRPAHVSKEVFLKRLSSHVKLAALSLRNLGMQAYIVLANSEYEVAYINWSSKADHDRAFEKEVGKKVFADASEFMKPLFYAQTKQYRSGSSVQESEAYSTISK